MRIPRRSLLMLAAAGAGSALLTACGGGDDDHNPPKNLVEVAQSLPDFSILVEAVVAADLATTLSGTGPFTVFAPTNAAFAALLTELGVSKEALLANKALLTAVLTYHVLPAKVEASAVAGVLGQPIATVQGGVFKIESNNGLKITDGRNRVATITATDVAASNGVIHVIDKVILPADKTIVETAIASAPERHSVTAMPQGTSCRSRMVRLMNWSSTTKARLMWMGRRGAAASSATGRDRRKPKQLPLPSSLSTQTAPSIRSIRR